MNAYLLHYLQPASYQTPYSPSQHSAATHKTHTHMQHSIKDRPTYIYTLHDHGHGLNIIKPTTILTLVCICDLCCVLSRYCCVQLCDPMDCTRQASLSMGFSRQEYWSGLPCPPAGEHPNSGIKPMSPASPALQVDSLLPEPLGKPTFVT